MMNMPEMHESSVYELDKALEKHIKVANMLASVTLFQGHSTLLDRLANALSIDAVQRAIYEANRIISTIYSRESEDEYIEQEIKEGKPYIYVKTKDKDEPYQIFGYLASSQDINDFLKDCVKDIRVARIIAASAMGIYASTLKTFSKQLKKQSEEEKIEKTAVRSGEES